MEQNALLIVMTEQYPWLLAKAFKMLRHFQDAEDAVQNAYLKAWTHCPETSINERAWLERIVCNECIDWLRRRTRQAKVMNRYAHRMKVNGSVRDDRKLSDIAEGVRQLPSPYYEAVRLRYFRGDSISAISLCLGTSEGAVRSRLYYARRHLQNMRIEYLQQEEVGACANQCTQPKLFSI